MSIPLGDAPRPTYTPTSSRASSVSSCSQGSEASSVASSTGNGRPFTEKQKALRQVVGKLAGETISEIQRVGNDRSKMKMLVEIKGKFDCELANIRHEKASFIKRFIQDNEPANREVSAESKAVSKGLVYKALAIANPTIPTALTQSMFSLLDVLDKSETAKMPAMATLINAQSTKELFIPSETPPNSSKIQFGLRTVLKEAEKLIRGSTRAEEQQDLKAARDDLMSVLKQINDSESENIDSGWKTAIQGTLRMFAFESQNKKEE